MAVDPKKKTPEEVDEEEIDESELTEEERELRKKTKETAKKHATALKDELKKR